MMVMTGVRVFSVMLIRSASLSAASTTFATRLRLARRLDVTTHMTATIDATLSHATVVISADQAAAILAFAPTCLSVMQTIRPAWSGSGGSLVSSLASFVALQSSY